MAFQTRLIESAIDLAITERQGTLGGFEAEHVKLDDGSLESGDWSRERETANANRASEDPSVVAYIGPYNSGATGWSLPVTNKAGLLQLGPTATWPGLTQSGWDPGEPGKYYPYGRRNYVRSMPPDSEQGSVAARWAAHLKLKNAVAISDGSSYSAGLAASFSNAAAAVGLQVQPTFTLVPNHYDRAVQRLADLRADTLFYAPSTIGQATQFVKAMVETSAKTTCFMSDTAMADQLLDSLPANTGTEGNFYIASNGWTTLARNTAWDEFAAKFTKKFGNPPTQYAGNAYDLTNLVLDAIASSKGKDRSAIRDKVMATQDYKGVTGIISFDENGDNSNWRMSIYRINGAQFVFDSLVEKSP